MMKGIAAIFLAFLSVKTFCEASCPLTTTDDEIAQSQNIIQMNGTWSEYKKSAGFLTKDTCITYNIVCSNDTVCTVDLVQNGIKTISTTTLTKDETDITWGTKEVHINVNEKDQYALIWTCEGDESKTYQLAALVVDLASEETAEQVENTIKKVNVNYKDEPNIIDHKACDATIATINLAVVFIALLNLLF